MPANKREQARAKVAKRSVENTNKMTPYQRKMNSVGHKKQTAKARAAIGLSKFARERRNSNKK